LRQRRKNLLVGRPLGESGHARQGRVAEAGAELGGQFLRHGRKNLLAVGRASRLQVFSQQAASKLPAQPRVGDIGNAGQPLAGRADESSQIAQQGSLVSGNCLACRGHRLGHCLLCSVTVGPLDPFLHAPVPPFSNPSSSPSASFSMARISALISSSARSGCAL